MKREWERRGGRGERERSEGNGRGMGEENSFCDTSNGYKNSLFYTETHVPSVLENLPQTQEGSLASRLLPVDTCHMSAHCHHPE